MYGSRYSDGRQSGGGGGRTAVNYHETSYSRDNFPSSSSHQDHVTSNGRPTKKPRVPTQQQNGWSDHPQRYHSTSADTNGFDRDSGGGGGSYSERRGGSQENTGDRQSTHGGATHGGAPSRTVYDGRHDPVKTTSSSYSPADGQEKDFMMRVQRELEDQRDSWKSEIDRLSRSTIQLTVQQDAVDGPGSGRASRLSGRGGHAPDSPSSTVDFLGAGSSFDAGTNSYVDTTSGIPLFKAFVDVSEFDPSEVNVTVDKLSNKIVVEAHQNVGVVRGGSSRSFTQRVQMPRFADDARLVARMNNRGILKLEVPLIFYFPPSDLDLDRDSRAKSFVYEVRDDPTDPSRQLMEILVNTGRDVSARDLHVEVDDSNKLVVSAERAVGSNDAGGRPARRTVIKRYTLPPLADVTAITSRLGSDGRLTILIPIRKK